MKTVLSSILLALSIGLAQAQPITVTFSYEIKSNPPFLLGLGEKVQTDNPGSSVALLKALEETLDLNVEFQRIPWKRSLKELESNNLDGIFHASFVESRESLGVYPKLDGKPDVSRRLTEMQYHLYRMKGSKVDWDGKQFHNLNGQVAATLGYAITNTLKKMKVDLFEGVTPLRNLRMLTLGRVDAVASLGNSAEAFIKQYPEEFGEIERLPTPLKQKTYYLLLSHKFVKEHPDMAQKIWDQIAVLRESGRFEGLE